MKLDDVFTGLTDDRVTKIKTLIAELKAELDFLIKLDKDARIAANGVADGRYPFMMLSREYTIAYPEELMISAEEHETMLRIFYDFIVMSEIKHLLESLWEGVSDTTLQLGSNSYEKGRIVRTLAEVAIKRGIPGMEKVYDDLSRLFERGPRGKGDNGDADTVTPPPTV